MENYSRLLFQSDPSLSYQRKKWFIQYGRIKLLSGQFNMVSIIIFYLVELNPMIENHCFCAMPSISIIEKSLLAVDTIILENKTVRYCKPI